MKKILVLSILIIVAPYFISVNSSFMNLAASDFLGNKTLNKALESKEAGDIKGAINYIQRELAVKETVDSFESKQNQGYQGDIYTEKFLKILIKYLKADEVDYVVFIRQIAKLAGDTKNNFANVAEDLKEGAISEQNVPLIKEMKRRASRALVLHSFCTAPKKYQFVYDTVQKSLLRYFKGWKILNNAVEQKAELVEVNVAEALINFQKGNELLSQASSLMK